MIDNSVAITAMVHQELPDNPEALKTLETLRANGVDNRPPSWTRRCIAACTRLRAACLSGGLR
jgi:hypothetical protein